MVNVVSDERPAIDEEDRWTGLNHDGKRVAIDRSSLLLKQRADDGSVFVSGRRRQADGRVLDAWRTQQVVDRSIV